MNAPTYTCIRCGRIGKRQIVWSIFRGVHGWYCSNRAACAGRVKAASS